MSNILKFFLIFFVINNLQAKKCADKKADDADMCMGKILMIGDRSQQFRETLNGMQEYCKNITVLQQCVKKFSRECLPSFARQVTNQLITGVTKVNKPLCVSEESKNSFTKVAKCGNINLEAKHKCMDQFIDELKYVETESGDKKIPLVCCNFWKFKDCIKSTFASVEEKKCPKQSIEAILNLISGYSNETLDMVCSDYDDGSEKCKKLISEKNSTNSKSTKTNRKSKSRSHSILPSFISIFTTL